jgi:hypothetical protein
MGRKKIDPDHSNMKKQNIGHMELFKGTKDDLSLIMFDAVPECRDDCPIMKREMVCPYAKNVNKGKPCRIQRRYMQAVVNYVEKSVKKKDDQVMMKIGMMVVPIFQQLIRFKLEAHALNNDVMLGNKVHPIFKEIRETIKLADNLVNSLNPLFDVDKGRGILDGDADYYDKILNGTK